MEKIEKIIRFETVGKAVKLNLDSDIAETVASKLEEDGREVNENYNLKELIDSFLAEVNSNVHIIRTKDIEDDTQKSLRLETILINKENSFTRTLFEDITDLKLPKTQKGSKAVFNDYFGSFLDDLRAEQERVEQEQERKELTEKEEEEKEFFSNPIWNTDYILFDLPKTQKGRMIKTLNKVSSFNGAVMSLKNFLEEISPKTKEATNNMHKWNRRKYNGLDGQEQREYEAKLINGRTYWCENWEINKTIFDCLALEDITNEESLAS